MKVSGFSKVTKHKRFNYTPRYYNPDREERKARNQQIKEELGLVDEENKEKKPFRPEFKEKFAGKHLRKHGQSSKPPLYRIVITVITFLLVGAVVFLTFYLSSIMLQNA